MQTQVIDCDECGQRIADAKKAYVMLVTTRAPGKKASRAHYDFCSQACMDKAQAS